MNAFDLPIYIEKDDEYLFSFKKKVDTYIDQLERLKTKSHLGEYVGLIDTCIKETKNIKSRIVRIYNWQFNGKRQTGINMLVNTVEKYKSKLINPLIRSHAFMGNDYWNANNGDKYNVLYLYKGRIGEPYQFFTEQDMFHIPLTLRRKTSTQRYSMPGIPCIYLAQNSYVVWKEMKMPSFDRLSISAFKIKNPNLGIIDLTYPFGLIFEILEDPTQFHSNYSHCPKAIPLVIGNLALWPLVVAVSISCKEDNRTFKSEYVIPQLLMYCVNKKYHDLKVIGIAYHSNEINTSNNMFATNLAIPILDYRKGSKFGNIKEDIEVTEPINLDYFNKIYNIPSVMNSINDFAKGIGAGNAFSKLIPISSFNKLINNWGNASYDNNIEYNKTLFYSFDDYILYLKQFKPIC